MSTDTVEEREEREQTGKQSRATDVVATREGLRAVLESFELVITRGADRGKSFTSRSDRTVIGTHAGADLVLSDPTVSRFHCELCATDGGLMVRDLGSRNGTLLDGVQIHDARAREGSILALGQTKIKVGPRGQDALVPVHSTDRFGSMVGASISMRRVFALLEKASQSTGTVLIGGETGTGKEVAAESIHSASPRASGPFIVVDCGAIPANLLESELFGHEKGAFTGASARREGAFEAANGGTLFLDEIGELPLDLQVKLLRALEARQIKRIGSNSYIPFDARVVAATHRDLRTEVNVKRFRADLFYRLAVIEVTLPPLRERSEDLPLLIDVILARLGAKKEDEERMRSADMLVELSAHTWPGNVRELRNYLERCIFLGPLAPSLLDGEAPLSASPKVDVDLPLSVARERWTRAFEKQYLTQALDKSGGNVAAAARAAGVDRMHFYRLLWKNGLR